MGLRALVLAPVLLPLAVFVAPGVFPILGRDTVLVLDGIHRVVHGQVPHVDFSSQLGPALFLLPALFVDSSEALWRALPGFLVLNALVLALACLVLFRTDGRAGALHAIGVSLVAVLIAVSPIRSGDGWLAEYYVQGITWHRVFADVANALLFVVAAFLAARAVGRRLARKAPLAVAAVFAVAIVYAALLKITYALGLSALVGTLLFTRSREDAFTVGYAAALVLAAAGALWGFLPELVQGYLSDVALAGELSSRAEPAAIASQLLDLTYASRMAVAYAIALVFVLWGAGTAAEARLVALVAAASYAVALFLDVFDDGPAKLVPLYGVLLALGAAFAERLRPGRAALLGLSVLAVLGPLVAAKGHALLRYQRYVEAARADEGRLRNGFVVSDTSYGHDFASYVRSGERAIEEARAFVRDARGCALAPAPYALDIANPFPFLLRTPPPRTAKLWIHEGLNIAAERHPPFAELVGSANLVMLPRRPMWGASTRFLRRTYRADLRGLPVAASSPGWVVFYREDAPSACAPAPAAGG